MGKLNIKFAKGAFDKARKAMAEGGFDNVELEPGRYNGWIKDLRPVKTKNGDQLVLGIVVPEAKGSVGLFYSADEERLVWLLRDLTTLGYDCAELDETMLSEICEDLKEKNPVVQIKASRKGDYVNIRIEKLLEGQTKEDVGEASGTAGGEDAKDETNAKGAKGTKFSKTTDKAPPKSTNKQAAEPPAEEEVVEEEVVEEVKDEEVELQVGQSLKALIQGKLMAAKIVEINEKEEKVVVSASDGKKYRVGVDKLQL
jgi:hypothetical protein